MVQRWYLRISKFHGTHTLINFNSIDNSQLSFPSGHASSTISVLGFVVWYLYFRQANIYWLLRNGYDCLFEWCSIFPRKITHCLFSTITIVFNARIGECLFHGVLDVFRWWRCLDRWLSSSVFLVLWTCGTSLGMWLVSEWVLGRLFASFDLLLHQDKTRHFSVWCEDAC